MSKHGGLHTYTTHEVPTAPTRVKPVGCPRCGHEIDADEFRRYYARDYRNGRITAGQVADELCICEPRSVGGWT